MMLDVIHSEETFCILNKPADLLSCPGRGQDKQDSIQTRVPRVFPHAVGSLLVHRLDQATSGVMLVALTVETHASLRKQFEQREVEKSYVAILDGEVRGEEGTVELPFRLDVENRPHQIHDPIHGKRGITDWKVLERHAHTTRVLFLPRTGRTHQLRLHASHPLGLGCPISGDRLYGNEFSAPRLMLHAWRLTFTHPGTHQRVTWEAPLPF